MQYSTRSSRLVSIQGQQLPSIVTYFPENNNRDSRISASRETRSGAVEDGIEVVPIELQNSFSAKALTPSPEEKEVVAGSKTDPEWGSKRLPGLPKSAWNRTRVRDRIMAIICVQLLVLLVICMILMEVARKRQVEQALEAIPGQSTPTTYEPLNLTTGTFGLRLENAQTESSDCLPRPNESAAWTCSPGIMELTLLPPSADRGLHTLASLQYFNQSTSSPFYGEQGFTTESVRVKPFKNNTDVIKKYYFSTTYDRSVFLLQNRLVPEGGMRDLTPNWGMDIKPGEQPWYCVFKDIHIKGTIKAQEVASNSTSVNIEVNGQNIPRMPYIMSVREMIKPDSPKPVCVHMVMTDDRSLVPVNASMHELELNFEQIDMKRQELDKDTPKCLCKWKIG